MPDSARTLALLGGTPLFPAKLHVGAPHVGGREELFRRIGEALDRRWLTNNGELLLEFEARLATLLGVRHALALCNGTVALEIVARALDLSGEVIVPSFTFIATAHALKWQQIEPVFADVRAEDHLLDPEAVERAITPRTTAILAVHTWGQPCHVDALQDIAKRHRLKLVFDAAHAFACAHGGRSIGGFGDAEVFSFHATKFFHTFEGGAITTNDDGLARKIKLMRNFGFTGFDNVESVGVNGKMNEVGAAMGLTNLDQLDTLVDTNRRNYERYRLKLQGLPGMRLLEYPEGARRNYQHIVLQVMENAPIARDDLVEALWAENIIARRYFYPGCHRMEPYKSEKQWHLPETDRVAAQVVILPTGSGVGDREVDLVAGTIGSIVEHADAVQSALEDRPRQVAQAMRVV